MGDKAGDGGRPSVGDAVVDEREVLDGRGEGRGTTGGVRSVGRGSGRKGIGESCDSGVPERATIQNELGNWGWTG
jgi:hypothetical protein